MDRPLSSFETPEPDRQVLQRVRKQEPEIVAHVWCTQTEREGADHIAEARRGDKACAVCGRPGAVVVDAVSADVDLLGAKHTVHAVVLRHLRSEAK